MKRVLLTGAKGFIGRHCVADLLSKGYEVHGLSSRTLTSPDQRVQWHQADLLEPAQSSALVAKIQPTHLLHFAWYATPGKYWTALENLQWVEATLHLMREFKRQGGHRFVAAGSCAEYDWADGFCSEKTTRLAPATLYGACKLECQLTLEAFARQTNLSAAWGRVFFLYGPHEHPSRLVSSVVRSLLRGEPAPCSHGRQVRDFLSVLDVAEAFVCLLEAEVQGPVNIASGQGTTVKDIVFAIGEMIGRSDLIRLGAIETQVGDPATLVADVRRLTAEVGWKPTTGLNQRLRETIEWWQQNIDPQSAISS